MSKEHKGLRHNTGKLRYDLVHPKAEEGLVRVMTKGAEKYADRNWEKGMSWTSVLASLKRHLAAFEAGEDFDPESGLPHIDHVQANAHFLSAYYTIYPQGDNRPHKYLNEPKIGLDIDEVLCDWVGDWSKYRGFDDTPSSWYFDRGLTEEFNSMKEKGKIEEFYLSLQPLIEPEEIPFEPHCYITSRPVESEVTEKWLAMHGFPARPVYTTSNSKGKVEIALEQGLDIFIDDGYHNFVDLNKAGVCCFLMDAKHNRRYDVGYKRIEKISDIWNIYR